MSSHYDAQFDELAIHEYRYNVFTKQALVVVEVPVSDPNYRDEWPKKALIPFVFENFDPSKINNLVLERIRSFGSTLSGVNKIVP